jgi:hypothetical protein
MHGATHRVGLADTREPIAYDYHMPPRLRLRKLGHDPELFLRLTTHLADTLAQRKSVMDRSMNVDVVEKAYMRLKNIVPRVAIGEDCVKAVNSHIHTFIACPLATLSCFDIDNSEIDGFRDAFMTLSESEEPNTKADLLVGCQPLPKDQQEDWGSLWSFVTQPKDLRDPYFHVLYTEEYKSIRAGNPRTILGIYLIMWCLEKGYLATFWPKNECEDCPKFKKSHAAQKAYTADEDSDKPLVDAPTATKNLVDTDLDHLRSEIYRLIALANVYEERYNIPVKAKKGTENKRKRHEREPDSDESDELEEFMSYKDILEEAVDHVSTDSELNLPLAIQDGLIRWVLDAAYFLIQVRTASHGVRLETH